MLPPPLGHTRFRACSGTNLRHTSQIKPHVRCHWLWFWCHAREDKVHSRISPPSTYNLSHAAAIYAQSTLAKGHAADTIAHGRPSLSLDSHSFALACAPEYVHDAVQGASFGQARSRQDIISKIEVDLGTVLRNPGGPQCIVVKRFQCRNRRSIPVQHCKLRHQAKFVIIIEKQS